MTPKGEAYTYSANDVSVGDVDGDGQYEYVVKWEPSNAKDVSQRGYTGSVYLDTYELDGTLLNRLDLGSVRIPVPEGAQLQVEMDQSGPVKAVHVVTPAGQVTVTAYAAPRSGGLWHEVSTELATQLQQDGATDQLSGELRKGIGQVRDFVKNNKAASYTAAGIFGLALLNSLRGKRTKNA